MRSLDTNLLLRLVLADVPEQAAAVEKLLSDGYQRYEVADMAFAEMAWIMQGSLYGYSRERIAANIRSVLALPQINCNRAMLDLALPRYVKHAGISFVDACLASYAELKGTTPLLTFDKRLAKALPAQVAAV